MFSIPISKKSMQDIVLGSKRKVKVTSLSLGVTAMRKLPKIFFL